MLRIHLPVVPRAEEEAMMRACKPGEKACIRGPACLAARPLPRFRHWDYCVVCLRGNTLALWLQDPAQIVQPYRNIACEYSQESLLPWPGISDPFVRYCPQRYRWDGDRLLQVNVDDVRLPSLRHPARPAAQIVMPDGLPDVFDAFMASGLVMPRRAAGSIAATMQAVLWHPRAILPADSTWVSALQARFNAGAREAVWRFLEWYVDQNPVIRAHVAKTQPGWAARRPAEVRSKRARFVAIPLPAHWAPALPWRRGEQYFCPSCGDYKGALADQVRTDLGGKRTNEYRHEMGGVMPYYGAQNVCYSFQTGAMHCFFKKPNGVERTAKSCSQQLEVVDVVCAALCIKGKVYFPCQRCGVHMPRELGPLCVSCKPRPVFRCALCKRGDACYSVVVFRDSGKFGTHTVYLCARDHPPFVNAKQVWNETHLLDAINAHQRRMNARRRAAAVQRE